jgi:hypothetical protein
MRLFSYVVSFDTGFAPNPFFGFCTLACCKPLIRRTAKRGDIVIGLSRRSERLVFAMAVEESLDFEAYWTDPRFRNKRPIANADRARERRGDNIYEPHGFGRFRQLPSRHSHPDGTENTRLKQADLSGRHVLVSRRFVYYGEAGPLIPERLSFLAIGRGHRVNFTENQVELVKQWMRRLPTGLRGRPAMWPPGDNSWLTGARTIGPRPTTPRRRNSPTRSAPCA